MRRIARNWKVILGTLVAAIIFLTAASLAVQFRNYRAKIENTRADISFSGAVSGRMTQMVQLKNQVSYCDVSTVQGMDEWNAGFLGMLNGKPTEVGFALYPYHGAGVYTNPGIADAATLKTASPAELFKLTWDLHVRLDRDPAALRRIPEYATEPGTPSRGPLTDLIPLAGLGKASVTLNPDKKSGRLEALLMNSVTPTAPPVHLQGTFKCG